MKKYLFLSLVLASLILPWACSDNNNNPTKPAASGGSGAPTSTFTFTGPTNTPTNTTVPGAFTSTPTGTPTITATPWFTPAPAYVAEWKCASSPTGFAELNGAFNNGIISTGAPMSLYGDNLLYSTEASALYTVVEVWDLTTQNTNPISNSNIEVVGPCASGSTTVIIDHAQSAAWCYGTCYQATCYNKYCLLDQTPNGGASLYCGSGFTLADINNGTSYGIQQFKSPQAMCTDGIYLYIADTGNAWTYEMDPSSCPAPAEIHPWKGYSPQNFIKPVAIACDKNGNVFVADNGYNPTLIQEFASGGVTFLNQWYCTPGCVANGMAVSTDGSGNEYVYVSDMFYQQVEKYLNVIPPSTPNTPYGGNYVEKWGNPHGPHEFQPFLPSCIAFTSIPNYIYVGDQNNNTIEIWNNL